MSDGDRLAFRYFATADVGAIAVSGNPTFAETGSTASIAGDTDALDNAALDNAATYHETDIEFSDLELNCILTELRVEDRARRYVLTWEIETNKRGQVSNADSLLTDTIDEAIQGISKYTGRGVEVKCYDGNELRETRFLIWDDLGVDTDTAVSWTYHIPELDPLYRYVLTYQTVVDMPAEGSVTAVNTAAGKGGIDSDIAFLSSADSDLDVQMSATNVGTTHVTWEIRMTLSGDSFDFERLLLVGHSGNDSYNSNGWSDDRLPYRNITIPNQEKRYFRETLQKVEVLGLEGEETFALHYNGETYTPNDGSYVLEGSFKEIQKSAAKFSIEFFKDAPRQCGGLNRPDGDTEEIKHKRTIIVRLTTEFSSDWAIWATLFDVIRVDNLQSDKYFLTKGSQKLTQDYFPLVYGQSLFFDAPGPTYTFGYGNASEKAENNGCSIEYNDTGFRAVIGAPFRQEDGSLYPFYGLEFCLIPKNEEALKKIEDAAALNGQNKAPYVITVSVRGTSASATVNIGVNNDFTPLDSASTAYVDLSDATRIALTGADGLEAEDIARYVMHYSLVFNKDRARLNAGNAFTVEDEYSSKLAVDVNSISIVTKPDAAVSAVSYYISDNTIYFTIPDETRVEVEFDAVLLNPAAKIIPVSNEARILHCKKALSDEIDCIGADGISDLTPCLLVRVYPSGHMEAGLNGAKFQLFEYNDESYSSGNSNTVSDWTPVVLKPGTEDEHSAIFTTSQLTVDGIDYGDGYAEICLNEDVDGQTLVPGKVYGLREITTPVSTAANGDTIHYSDPHTNDFYCYVFSIGDSADYANGVYRPNDVLSIRNEPTGISMTLKAQLGGNCTLTDEAKSALTFQLFRKAVPEEGQPAVYMPVMTERENGEGLALLDPVVITYDQASIEIGIDIDDLKANADETACEYLIVTRGIEGILSAHPDWDWRGDYAWNDGPAGSLSNNYEVYDENGTNAQTVRGIPFLLYSGDFDRGRDRRECERAVQH